MLNGIDPAVLFAIVLLTLLGHRSWKASGKRKPQKHYAVVAFTLAFVLAWQNIPGLAEVCGTFANAVGLTAPVMAAVAGPCVMLAVAVYGLARMASPQPKKAKKKH